MKDLMYFIVIIFIIIVVTFNPIKEYSVKYLDTKSKLLDLEYLDKVIEVKSKTELRVIFSELDSITKEINSIDEHK